MIQVPSEWGTRFSLHQSNHPWDWYQAIVQYVTRHCKMRMSRIALSAELVFALLDYFSVVVCLTDLGHATELLKMGIVAASENVQPHSDISEPET